MSLDDPADPSDGENDVAAGGGRRGKRGAPVPAPVQRPEREPRPGGSSEHCHGSEDSSGFEQDAEHARDAKELKMNRR